MPDGVRRPDATGASAERLFVRRNDVLAEICQAIARSPDHREVVQESALRLQRYFGTASLLLFFEADGSLLLEAVALADEHAALREEIRAGWTSRPASGDRPAVQCMRRRQILRWSAAEPTLPADVRALLLRAAVRAVVAIPISVDGGPIGACVLCTPQGRPLTAGDEALLETALGVVGVVYRRGVLKELEAEHQRQALQAHELETIAELAARVAHEINNPLNTIVQASELLLQRAPDAETREQLRAILHEALRAAGTVRSLQVFARSDAGSVRATAPTLTILVVEDEPQVARSVMALLARDGHRVELAASAEDAVARLREEDRYDVILSDFRMPGMGGEGLCTWMRAEKPAALDRLLFMSGDLLSARTEAFLRTAGRPVLAKPFTHAALRAALAPFAERLSAPGEE